MVRPWQLSMHGSPEAAAGLLLQQKPSSHTITASNSRASSTHSKHNTPLPPPAYQELDCFKLAVVACKVQRCARSAIQLGPIPASAWAE